MSAADLVIRGERVVRDGAASPAAIHVREGRIVAVTDFGAPVGGATLVEAGSSLVTSGLVDAHVHVNEPGRTEWEGYASATASASAGGVTTIVDMPLNGVPPLTSADAGRARVTALRGSARVDVALWGGIVSADPSALPALADFGVAGCKCFLSPSGVDEFPNVGEAELEAVLPVLRDLGLPLLAHAEDPTALARAAAALPRHTNPRSYATWLASRPPEAEVEAIDLLVRLCRRHRARVHVVHVSSREGAARIASAKAEGLPVTAETCPHYLTFSADEVPDGATLFKCAPPIRGADQRAALASALENGTLDLVTSDHSPCPPAMKHRESGDFLRAWGGIAGLQLLLPATLTCARSRGLGVARVVRWLSEAPSDLAGLAGRKGRIAPGFDADLALWDEERFTVEPEALLHRHRPTPYAGRALEGVVQQTWLRGRLVYDRERGPVGPASGEFLPVRRRRDAAART